MSALLRRDQDEADWPDVDQGETRGRSFKGLYYSVLRCIAAQRGFAGLYVPGDDDALVPYIEANEGLWYFPVPDDEDEILVQTRFSDHAMLLQFASLGYEAFMALAEPTAHPPNTMAHSMLELMREPETDEARAWDWLRAGVTPSGDPGYVSFGKHALACEHVAATPSLATHVRFNQEKKKTLLVCDGCCY
jgi:hypothetical protein